MTERSMIRWTQQEVRTVAQAVVALICAPEFAKLAPRAQTQHVFSKMQNVLPIERRRSGLNAFAQLGQRVLAEFKAASGKIPPSVALNDTLTQWLRPKQPASPTGRQGDTGVGRPKQVPRGVVEEGESNTTPQVVEKVVETVKTETIEIPVILEVETSVRLEDALKHASIPQLLHALVDHLCGAADPRLAFLQSVREVVAPTPPVKEEITLPPDRPNGKIRICCPNLRGNQIHDVRSRVPACVDIRPSDDAHGELVIFIRKGIGHHTEWWSAISKYGRDKVKIVEGTTRMIEEINEYVASIGRVS